ncbi:MAG: hypothetical protein QOG87_4276 [Actinomycetota bacterium]|jgi:hypothetical protein
MGTRFQTATCPLCGDAFDDPGEYRDHLAFMHDLVDDDGAETTLPEAPPEPPAPVVVPPLERVEPVPFVAPAAAHPGLTGPVAVQLDRRVLPGLVVAVALQLVIALLGLVVVDGGNEAKVDAASGSTEAAEKARGAGVDPAEGGTTTLPPTTTAPAVNTAGDQARADGFVLRAADLPAGWEELDPEALAEDSSSDAGAGCTVPDDPTESDALTGEAGSAFLHDMSFAFSGALVLRTEKDAVRAMEVFRELMDCFADDFVAGVREGAEGATVTHGEFASLGYPMYGDETTASSMPVTVSGPGGRVPLRVDLLAVRRDRAVSYVMAIVGANDFTPQHERGMLSAIADRMAPRSI